MKKHCISLSILFALTLSTVQPLAAVSFKEWAQNYMKKFSPEQLREKAIAAAQKLKGLKLKDAWNKIDFMGRAERELYAAGRALEICKSTHCASQLENTHSLRKKLAKCWRKAHSRFECPEEEWEQARNVLQKCAKSSCTVEQKAFKQASANLLKSIFAIPAIIGATLLGVTGGVGLGIYLYEKKAAAAIKPSPDIDNP